jgi:hypothetical protein
MEGISGIEIPSFFTPFAARLSLFAKKISNPEGRAKETFHS